VRAAVVRESGAPLVIEERPVPEPGPGQVVIRLEASGLCHTGIADLATVFDLHRQGRTRVIPETRPLEAVNQSIDEVLHGKARARIVLQP